MDQARLIEGFTYSGASEQALEKEHIAIENAFTLLSEAVDMGSDPKTVARLLDTIVFFSEAHFSSEEQYFDRRGYLDADIHAAAHNVLLRKFRAARVRAGEGRREPELNISGLLRNFHDHIDYFDKPAHDHLYKAGAVGA